MEKDRSFILRRNLSAMLKSYEIYDEHNTNMNVRIDLKMNKNTTNKERSFFNLF